MRTRLAIAVLLTLALVATACRSPDPQERLEDAFARTFDGSFAYELTIEADQEALRGLGPEATQAGAFLGGLALAGQRSPDGFELRLGFGGFDLAQLRSLGEEELYVRLALDQLGAFIGGGQGFDPDTTIVPPLEQAGVSRDVIDAVRAAFDGRWVGIEGEIDSDALQGALGATPTEPSREDEEAVREALCDDLEGFARCYIVVQEVDEQDGRTVFQVQLALRELARALAEAAPTGDQVEDLDADLAELPEQVPATVVAQDGVVTRLSLDVAEAMRSAGADAQGTIELRLDLTDHGEVEEVTVPEGAVTITGGELADAMAAMADLMNAVGEFQPEPDPDPIEPTITPTVQPSPGSG